MPSVLWVSEKIFYIGNKLANHSKYPLYYR